MTSGRSKLKGEVELFQYGGLLFHTAGTGFVQYDIPLKFSSKTVHKIYFKNCRLITACMAHTWHIQNSKNSFCHVKGRWYSNNIHGPWLTERIFAVLCASIMGLTRCYKTTFKKIHLLSLLVVLFRELNYRPVAAQVISCENYYPGTQTHTHRHIPQ